MARNLWSKNFLAKSPFNATLAESVQANKALIAGAKVAAGSYDDAQSKALSDISSSITDTVVNKENEDEEEKDNDNDEEDMGYVGPEITLVG